MTDATSRRSGCEDDASLAPVNREEQDEPDQAQEEQAQEEQAQEEQEESGVADDAHEDDRDGEEEEEARHQRSARDPGQPSREEREEHERTHIPFRPWCEACVKGKSKRKPSTRIAGDYAHSDCCRLRMDYAYLTEDVEATEGDHGEEESAKAESTLTVLVVQESQHRSVWAYAVEAKGASEDWPPLQILEDMETIGVRGEKLVLKSDQEPAIVDLAREIAKMRESAYGTAVEQSAVGESDSNASVERAIQDVEGQVRTLRAGLEAKIRQRIRLTNPVVPWMVRHAAALITRCRVRPSGRTSLEMMRGRRTNSQITEFGEHILFKIPKTKLNPGKFEDQWTSGVDLGFDMRSMETLVGTASGVFKCTDFRRKPLQERWSADMVNLIQGSPKQPVPGQVYRRTPAFSKRFSRPSTETEDRRPVAQPTPQQPETRNFSVF